MSRNLGNHLSDSVNRFWAIAHGKRRKTSKNYKSTGAPGKITKALRGYLEHLEGQGLLETHVMCK